MHHFNYLVSSKLRYRTTTLKINMSNNENIDILCRI